MSSTPVGISAAIKAKWLAETAATLARAQDILTHVEGVDCDNVAFAELMLRIGAAAREVDLLRAARPTREEHSPKWTNLPPWDEPRSGF